MDEKKPTQRLLAAISHKNGVSQTELAEWYDVQRRTIYSWLKRLDIDESLEQAVSDAKRTGRNKNYQNHSWKSLIIVLDRAPYFQASAVTDLAAHDDLAFVTLPSYPPELNPVEECWRQLQNALATDSLILLTS